MATGYSAPETITDDAGNIQPALTLTVTGPSAYTGTALTDSVGVFRLGPLPQGDYTVTYGARSVIVPVLPVTSTILDTTTGALRVPDWVTARAYVVGELVASSGVLYRTTTAHTSAGAFDASKFTAIGGGAAGALLAANNLSDVAAAATSRTNLGLGNVDNTSDVNKPVSTAQATADALAVPKSLVDVKGDLLVGSANDTLVRRAVGTDGQVFTADSTSADGVKWAAGGARSPVYGTGLDGNVTITGTVTLTRDMEYDNLVVNGTLEVSGCRVFVKGALSGAGAIKFTAYDNNQTGGGVPTNTTTGFFPSPPSGGAGGTAAGSASPDPGFAQQIGGAGGTGGTGTSGSGGTSAQNPITLATYGVALANATRIHPLLLLRGSHTSASLKGGAGGGGGGGDGTVGGGGGQAGGVVLVFAADASAFTGTIAANGGFGATTVGGNRGGGGGGGGGIAALLTGVLPTGAYTITANGGVGGAATGTGTAGAAGSTGTVIAAVL